MAGPGTYLARLSSLGLIQTLEHLTRKGMQPQNICTFCKQQPECINHLFLHWVLSQSVWIELVDFSIDSVDMLSRFHSLEELLNRWPRHNSGASPNLDQICKNISLCFGSGPVGANKDYTYGDLLINWEMMLLCTACYPEL
ncbi:hypothetical protein FRX31_033985 [Thalictrum thalictroides]|uniref:Uncharacterized protein n=1 Tax=Thalictrum thalictroides TaxID=46969 RepID=A0A7J6UV33_THATH|nr:hypothetical protein FRX31_033985 [Thalictrum thalictroides]